jgi:transcriptional regulator with PAS, ATPase and Fis domain
LVARGGTINGLEDLEDPLAELHTRNPELRRLIEYARDIASTSYAVLIEGETGTGKEVFARGIHAASRRRGRFVPVNCSAIPENMFEAELFGARRGAYTGLETERPGLFRIARGGTLFLDEVGDLPSGVQAKLLRVLDDGVIRALGATEWIAVDTRIIAATHKGLANLVDEGLFRSDLFFRLTATYLQLPPIRDRPEDLPMLIGEALDRAAAMQSIPRCSLHPSTMAILLDYPWPGNVRELRNVIATAVLRAANDMVEPEHLPPGCRDRRRSERERRRIRFDLPFFEALEEFEREYIADVLRRCNGNISAASRSCKLSRGALRNKARSYGLLGHTRAQTHSRERVRRSTTPGDDS